MTKPSKLLLCGVALAVVIAVAGYFVERYQTQQWRAATATRAEIDQHDNECADRWVKDHPQNGGGDAAVDADFAKLEAEGACGDMSKVAREEADARRGVAIESAVMVRYWAPRLALGVFAVLALPWFWYFLLRRIAELRGAILGKPPTL